MYHPDRAMSINGSGLCDDESENKSVNNEAMNDKWTVEALKEYLRKCGGKASGKQANLIEVCIC